MAAYDMDGAIMPTWMYMFPNGAILGLFTAFLLVFGAGRTYWVDTATLAKSGPPELRKFSQEQRRQMRRTVARSLFMLAMAGCVGWPSLFTLWYRDSMAYAYTQLQPAFAGTLEFSLAIIGAIGTSLVMAYGVVAHRPHIVLSGLALTAGAIAGMADLIESTVVQGQWLLVNTFAWLTAIGVASLMVVMVIHSLIDTRLRKRDQDAQRLGAETAKLADDNPAKI